tara:strand:+ start:953 stop:1576 length:624 start_codon:yes stop_codon:yes gene_type:complete
MAISTYSELKTAMADFLNREDLTSIIPTFISLGEARMSRDVRHWQMENRAATTIDGQYSTRPSDWVETIRLHLTGQDTSVVALLSTQAMADKRQKGSNVAGKPAFYSHSEDQFEVFPTPDGSYAAELLYIQKIPALSDTVTTNWLLSSYPDIYLYGSLLNSAPYLAEDGRAEVWARLYGEAVDKLNVTSKSAAYSGVGLTTKIRGLG